MWRLWGWGGGQSLQWIVCVSGSRAKLVHSAREVSVLQRAEPVWDMALGERAGSVCVLILGVALAGAPHLRDLYPPKWSDCSCHQ